MTAEQLFDFLCAQGIAAEAIRIRDAQYVFPSRAWLYGPFADGFAQLRPQFDLGEWKEELADCDDFEDLALVYARYLHRCEQAVELGRARAMEEQPDVSATSAIAMASFEYVRRDGDAHAINCAIVNEDGSPELVFFEPQTGKAVDLAPEEVCSCEEIRF